MEMPVTGVGCCVVSDDLDRSDDKQCANNDHGECVTDVTLLLTWFRDRINCAKAL